MDLNELYKAKNSNNNQLIEDKIQLVSFIIGYEEFGINILHVQEIIKLIHITRVPNAEEYIAGVINLRGKVIPVMNMRKRMEMEEKEYNSDMRIIVVEVNKIVLGFIVDSVNEVIRIDRNTLEETPKSYNSRVFDFVNNIAKLNDRLIILIDLEKLISDYNH
ncbi:MAG: chemotaxis protein CheW [Candidatus Kapaibacteriota bacterium]|jgi:purine-binding chemotaxis protein CheW